MNILGFVFFLLLILSYGFYACWEKQIASSRLLQTYIGHQVVNRDILNRYQNKIYRSFSSNKNPVKKTKKTKATSPPKPKKPELNRDCAKLNLWPLIQEGRENHPLLYELALKMLRSFYAPLAEGEKRFEAHLLDALLTSAKSISQEREFVSLEKVDLNDCELQKLYYKMLKGTKHWDLQSQVGYPSLLDYMKASPSKDKICIFHAHPDLITVLFGPRVALKLYQEIHRKNGPFLTRELIQHLCNELHQITMDPTLFDLLELGRPRHEEMKKTFIAEDEKTDVSLRKNFYLKG